MSELILASGSPRRKAILEWGGVRFRQVIPDVPEESTLQDPHDAIQEISDRKARSISEQFPDSFVLAMDTLGVFPDGSRIGKTSTISDAAKMWARLQKVDHEVVTAVSFFQDGEPLVRGRNGAVVRLGKVPNEIVLQYLESGLWKGKAGAYGIQDALIHAHVSYTGSFSAIIGCPLDALQVCIPLAGQRFEGNEEDLLADLAAGRFQL